MRVSGKIIRNMEKDFKRQQIKDILVGFMMEASTTSVEKLWQMRSMKVVLHLEREKARA